MAYNQFHIQYADVGKSCIIYTFREQLSFSPNVLQILTKLSDNAKENAYYLHFLSLMQVLGVDSLR